MTLGIVWVSFDQNVYHTNFNSLVTLAIAKVLHDEISIFSKVVHRYYARIIHATTNNDTIKKYLKS